MTNITTDQRAFLDRHINFAFQRVSDIIEHEWPPRPLDSKATFIFKTDGLDNEFSVDTNLFAALSFTLHMANEWGWGMIEVFTSLKHDVCIIEQNGLTWIPDCFKFLEHEFDCTSPEVPGPSFEASALFRSLMENFAREVFYSPDSVDKARQAEWFNQTIIAADQTTKAAVTKLIRQLEEGLPLHGTDTTNIDSANQPTETRIADVPGLIPAQFGFTYSEGTNQNERQLLEKPTTAPSILPPRLVPTVALAQTPDAEHPEAITMAIKTAGNPSDPVCIQFETLNDALLASANRAFNMAACWKLLEKVNANDVDTLIEGLPIAFQTATQSKLDELDIGTEDASDLIISALNGKLI